MSNLYERNGIWWARFKVAGKSYRRSLHTRSEAAAKKRLKAVRDAVIDEVRFGIAAPMLWQQAVIDWESQIDGKLAPATINRYLDSLEQVRQWLDGRHLHEIDHACISALVKGRRGQAVTNATVRRDLTAISSVLSHAVDEEWIETNPVLAYNRSRIPERRNPIVLPREASLALVIGPKRTRFGDMLLFARETGMRLEEIGSLQHHQIDTKNAMALLTRTKGNRARAVPLTADALRIVRRQPRNIKCPYVFWHMVEVEQDGEMALRAQRYTNISSNHRDYCARAAARAAKAKVEFHRFRFHDLRHLFAVEFLRHRRGSIYDLQRILGHRSIKTTELYLDYLTPEEARDAMYGVAQKVAHT